VRVLLIGVDSSLGTALQAQLMRWGRHEVETSTLSGGRWKSERQAKKAVRRAKPDMIVDLRMIAAADSGELIHDQDLERCHWLAKACQRNDISYLLTSSARVFSGLQERPYRELDEPENSETIGELLRQAEAHVRDTCEAHLILRLGPIFAPRGMNVLTHMLGRLREGGELVLDNHLRGCPVEASDAARVISALLDQFSAGAESWGTFHYCSSDATNCYEFAEVLLASASQFSEFGPAAVTLAAAEDDRQPLNRSLDCGLIRNHFAIKQVPWRGYVADAVKTYFALAEEEED
jgi:dTDP-4-dehydrorhamnose reductase